MFWKSKSFGTLDGSLSTEDKTGIVRDEGHFILTVFAIL